MDESLANKKYEEFLTNLNNWIQSRHILRTNIDEEQKEEIGAILALDIAGISRSTALQHAYKLNSYLDYLQTEINQEKTVLNWCDDSIMYIVADKINNYRTDGWTKWEQMFTNAIKENTLASDIYKLRNNVKARVVLMDGRIIHIKRMADILFEVNR